MRMLLTVLSLLCLPGILAVAADKDEAANIGTGVQGKVRISYYRPRYMPLLRPGQVDQTVRTVPPPAPAAGFKVRILAKDKDTLVKETTTDQEGKFLIDLPAGEYRLQMVPDKGAHGPGDVKVTVTEGKMSDLGTVEMMSMIR
jgi:hypothetical protein